MGRVYVKSTPATRGEEEPKKAPADPVDSPAIVAASATAGDPPTREDKQEAKRAEKAGVAPVDPAAEAPDEVVEEASEAAGNPPPDPPAPGANRDEWAAYARSRGATDEDLLDESGKPLGRNAVRDKYQLI